MDIFRKIRQKQLDHRRWLSTIEHNETMLTEQEEMENEVIAYMLENLPSIDEEKAKTIFKNLLVKQKELILKHKYHYEAEQIERHTVYTYTSTLEALNEFYKIFFN
jgi:hypothetical protein